MKIIELKELEFRNYAKKHINKNYYQTAEYGSMEEIQGYKKLYLALVDNNCNILGATLILEKNINIKYKMGYAPKGYLIDYTDYELIKMFSKYLRLYLSKLNYLYLRINPLYEYKIYNKSNKIITNNSSFIWKLRKNRYNHLIHAVDFSKYSIVLNTEDKKVEDIYNTFNTNTKRNIKKCAKLGITTLLGNNQNIDLFYEFVKNIGNKDLNYYKDLQYYFNNDDNKFEIYFSCLNTEIYLNNARYILKEKRELVSKLNEKLGNHNINDKTKEKILNKKIVTDKIIDKYSLEVIKATNIYRDYPNGIIIGGQAIIKNNKTIYFLTNGYEEKYKDIFACYTLKWEIIKKYMNEGYKIFNLGEISNDKNKKNSKYYGLYLSKISLGGNIVEYPGGFDLLIRPLLYYFFRK